MRYGVVICPKCGMAKGVEASRKTTTCQCGHEIDMSRAKLISKTDSPLELADLVAQANALLRGGERPPAERKRRSTGPYAAAAERAKPIKDALERMKAIAEELTKQKNAFTLEDLRRVSAILGKDSAEDILARLLEHNLVYEVEEGTYRSV